MNYKLVSLWSVFAVILGGLTGYFLPDVMISIGFIGTLFVNGLQLLVFPVLLVFVITGISQMKDHGKIKRSFGKTSLYVLTVSFTASLFGLLMSLLFQSGVGIDKSGAHIPEELIPMMNDFSVLQVIGSMIPNSFFEASMTVKLFGLLLFAVMLGIALSKFKKSNKVVTDFFASSNEIMNDILKYVQYALPLGLFSLVGSAFASNGTHTALMFSTLFMYSLLIVFSFSFFALVILPLGMRIYTHQSAYGLFVRVLPALSTAFATNSQAAALPVTKHCVDTDSTIDDRSGSFMLPFGAVFNSCGTALFLSASSVFVAQMYDVSLTIMQMLGILFVSTLISLIANFIPLTSLLILALVVQFSNLPIHVTAGVGILVLLEFLFSRLRTVVNVWTDVVGTAVLSETFDFKTAAVSRPTRSKSVSSEKRHTTRKTTRTQRTKEVRSTDKRPERSRKSDTNKSKPREKYDKKNGNSSKPGKATTKQKPIEKPKAKEAAKSSRVQKPVKQEAKKKFEMPPVPYHVLENELKPTPKTTAEVTKEVKPVETVKEKPVVQKVEKPVEDNVVSKPKDDDSVITKAKTLLSQDTIKREREKISAQLESMRKRESNITVEPIENSPVESADSVLTDSAKFEQPKIQTADVVVAKSDKKPVSEDSDRGKSAHVDFLSSDFSKESDSEKTENGQSQEVKPLETVAVKAENRPSKIEYGRGRSKKSEKSNEENDSPAREPKETVEPAEPEFSKDEMTFGRGRKKK